MFPRLVQSVYHYSLRSLFYFTWSADVLRDLIEILHVLLCTCLSVSYCIPLYNLLLTVLELRLPHELLRLRLLYPYVRLNITNE